MANNYDIKLDFVKPKSAIFKKIALKKYKLQKRLSILRVRPKKKKKLAKKISTRVVTKLEKKYVLNWKINKKLYLPILEEWRFQLRRRRWRKKIKKCKYSLFGYRRRIRKIFIRNLWRGKRFSKHMNKRLLFNCNNFFFLKKKNIFMVEDDEIHVHLPYKYVLSNLVPLLVLKNIYVPEEIPYHLYYYFNIFNYSLH